MHLTANCWDILQLPADADLRSIKRQYASLLKVTRPDEDRQAFQRLREAYEQALQLSQEAADRRASADEPVVHPRHAQAAPIPQTSGPAQVAPAPSKHEHAIGLVSHIAESGIEQAWSTAQASGCAAEFERLVLQHCLDDPQFHAPLLQWGLEQRQWLTPWQQMPVSESYMRPLLAWLTRQMYLDLERCLTRHTAADFLAGLQGYSRQGWLGAIERREALQVSVLQLLINHENWAPELLPQISAVFGWSADSPPPIADEPWQALQARCQQMLWRAELEALSEDASPLGSAARLFLISDDHERQVLMAANFDEADWQACEKLSKQLLEHFANLPDGSPNHDPWFWRALVGTRHLRRGFLRSTAILSLSMALSLLPGQDLGLALIMLPLYIVFGLIMAMFGSAATNFWYGVIFNQDDLDARCSGWLARKGLIGDRRYRVIRLAGPLTALGLTIWGLLGILGLATYLLTGLIASRRLGKPRWPQWLFCSLMIVLIGYLQMTHPGTALTQGWLKL